MESRPPSGKYSTEEWAKNCRGWSAEFNKHAKILASSVRFRATRESRTLVNTEGTSVQRGSNLFRVELQGSRSGF